MNQVFRIILKTPLSISAAVCRNQVSVFWQILQESEKLNVKTFAVTYFSLKIARLPYVEIKYLTFFQKLFFYTIWFSFSKRIFLYFPFLKILYIFQNTALLKIQVSFFNRLFYAELKYVPQFYLEIKYLGKDTWNSNRMRSCLTSA